jgi:hypothetical protein
MAYNGSYESLMKKNAGYRQLGNYYNKLYGNVTTSENEDNGYASNGAKVVAVPVFGGVGINNNAPVINVNGNGENFNQKCNTWRAGECSDGRSLNKNAYTQCESGQCGFYKDVRNDTNSSFYSRY